MKKLNEYPIMQMSRDNNQTRFSGAKKNHNFVEQNF